MIIVKLMGGLGNQMFQFAVASILSKKTGKILYLDVSFFKINHKEITPRNFQLGIFNNDYRFFSSIYLKKLLKKSFIKNFMNIMGIKTVKKYSEKSLNFDSNILKLTPPVHLVGYFQSYKYFEGNESLVRNLFRFDVDELNDKNKNYLCQIKSSYSVSVHIRRGDYVSNKTILENHGVCSLDYYRKAIKVLSDKLISFKLFFFSDDIDWVKDKFSSVDIPKVFVVQDSKTDWVDMFLMSSCKHQIIANSSFSWWSAWLNSNSSKIVIAPKVWNKQNNLDYSTLLPEYIIRL